MEQTITSPCVGQCGLNEDDICMGCFRTREEVISWTQASNEERLSIISSSEQRKSQAGLE